MTFGAGELNVCAELQKKVPTRTAAGGTDPGWVRERDVWLRIRGLNPKLRIEAMSREPQITHEIIARQEDDIDPTKRFVVRGDDSGVLLLNGLKYYYRADEASGTRFDEGPNGLDVAQVGNVGNVSGVRLLGINGTGNNSNYLEAAHNDLFRVGDNPFTLSYWAYIPAGTLTSNHPAVAHWNTNAGATQAGYLAYMRNSNDRHTLEVTNDGSTPVRVSWGAAPVVDTWQHIVCKHDPDADEISISVDRGTPVTQAFAGGIFAATAPFNLTLMRVSSIIIAAIGDVDEIGAWDRLLTEDELDVLNTAPDFLTFAATIERTFMIDGIPAEVDEPGGFIRMMAVEGVAT